MSLCTVLWRCEVSPLQGASLASSLISDVFLGNVSVVVKVQLGCEFARLIWRIFIVLQLSCHKVVAKDANLL